MALIRPPFRLVHAEARRRCAAFVESAPDGTEVRFSEATRNGEQNAKLHACLSDIAKQVQWAGQKLPLDVWKRLCTAAWLRERRESPMMIPALDGQGFDVIYERTSKLSVKQCAELIEWCLAFGAEHGVVWSEK